MKLTPTTQQMLRCRRIRRKLIADGYEEVGEDGGRLWELHRGCRYDHQIVDVAIGPEGKSLFIKTERLILDAGPGRIIWPAFAGLPLEETRHVHHM